MTQVALATEDALSEKVGLQLLSEINLAPQEVMLLRKGGSGYLRSKMDSWRNLAQQKPVLLITDLDRVSCPVKLMNTWLEASPAPPNLFIRIAVREIESWLLADHEAVRQLIGGKGKLPPQPDALPDPKSHLLQLAKLAGRDVRADLVKEKDAMASQGLGYNARLSTWLASSWSAERAATRSPSLARTRFRLQELASRFPFIHA